MELETIVDQVLARIGRGSGAARKAEDGAAGLEARRQVFAERQRLREELEKRAPGLAKATAQAAAKLEAARAAAEEAQQAYNAASLAERNSVTSLEGQIAECERRLRATSSPKIDALRAKLLAEMDDTRAMEPESFAAMSRNPFTDRSVMTQLQTNLPTLEARQAALLAAFRSLEDLRIEVLSESEVAARIDGILGSIPEVAMEVITPAPRSPEAA